MKTFESEKGNIPDGATHYRNECDDYLFSFVKLEPFKMYLWCDTFWDEVDDNCFISAIKPIPQTKEVEWVNGDDCIYNGEYFKFVSYMCKPEEDHVVIWRSFSGIEVVYKTQISKPETEAELKERELFDSINEAYNLAPNGLDIPITMYVAKLLIQQGYSK